MRIFNEEGEKRYQEWVLKFCAKETKGQGEVPYGLLQDTAADAELIGKLFPATINQQQNFPSRRVEYDII